MQPPLCLERIKMEFLKTKVPSVAPEERGACLLAAYLAKQKKEINRILEMLHRGKTRGRIGIWECRREPDGTVECRARYKCEQVDTTEIWGSLYHSWIEYGGIKLPFVFDERPMVIISVIDTNGRGYMLRHSAPSSAERLGKWYFVLPKERTTDDCEDVTVEIYVKGRIKQ